MPTSTLPNSIIKDSFAQSDAINYYLTTNRQGLFPPEKIIFERHLPKEGRCLNIGCGSGREAIPLAISGLQVTAIDFVEELVSLTRSEAEKQTIPLKSLVGDCRNLMFKDKTFDCIVMISTIIQLLAPKERQNVFREIKRILKDNGILILHTDNCCQIYDFPFSQRTLIKTIWKIKKWVFNRENSPLYESRLGRKLRELKIENLLILSLDALTTSYCAFVIDTKRAFFEKILGPLYHGPRACERLISKTFALTPLRRLPYHYFNAKHVQREVANSDMTLIDYQSDWELVYWQRLPLFLRSHAPITYYVVQNHPPFEFIPQERLTDVVCLLKSGLQKKSTMVFQIISNSMLPLLEAGDKLHASPSSMEDIRIGDVIIIQSDQQLIAHRIIGFGKPLTILTKGDNSPTKDLPIHENKIVAKVSAIESQGLHLRINTPLWQITNRLLAGLSSWESHGPNRSLKKTIIKLFRGCVLLTNPPALYFLFEKHRRLTLEKEIILRLCDKRFLDENPQALYELLKNCQHWHYFLSLILYNNIGPLLYKNLSELKTTALPGWFMNSLKESHERNVLKTNCAYQDLSDLLKEFHRQNIEVIVLKGAAIAAKIYKDLSLRPMEDVDLLIDRKDWTVIHNILMRKGFSSEDSIDLLTLEETSGSPMNRHLSYKNQNGTKIELKFYLFLLDFPNTEGASSYWKNSVHENIGDISAKTLCPEDQFLFLATRMINVNFRNLLWFYDLKEYLLCYPQLAWPCILEQAKQKGVSLWIYYSLKTLKGRFQVDSIPAEVLERLKPSVRKEEFFNRVLDFKNIGFRRPGRHFSFSKILLNSFFYLEKFGYHPKGFLRLLNHLWRLVFPPTAYLAHRYNLPRWQVYCGKAHWLRLKKAGIKLFSLC